MATTNDMTPSGEVTTAGSFPSRRGTQSFVTLKRRLTAAECVVATGTALIAADTFQIFNLPAYHYVLGGIVDFTTADTGTTLTVDLGIAAGDTLLDGGDGTTAGIPVVGTNGLLSGSAFVSATADTIDLTVATISAAADDWVAEITVICLDISAEYFPDSA
jgi:hypothetical protein